MTGPPMDDGPGSAEDSSEDGYSKDLSAGQ
jgi:hypothetical protein